MRFEIGTYEFRLPAGIKPQAEVVMPPTEVVGQAGTVWKIGVGMFTFFVHLDCNKRPEELHDFILSQTKQSVQLENVEINGIRGVKHGGYNAKRSWIDWRLRKGELLLSINLQAWAMPTQDDIKVHEEIMGSIRYVPR